MCSAWSMRHWEDNVLHNSDQIKVQSAKCKERTSLLFALCTLSFALATPSAYAASCGMQLNNTPAAFCETFNTAYTPFNRSGELNGTLWGVSRILGADAIGNSDYDGAAPSTMTACASSSPSSYQASPGTTDVMVCNNQARESTYDQHGVSVLAMYAKQP